MKTLLITLTALVCLSASVLAQTWPYSPIVDYVTIPRAVVAHDMDLDGDLDVLVGGGSDYTVHLAWFENTPEGPLRHDINDWFTPTDFQVLDMDNDNDDDVLASNGAVVWFERTGDDDVWIAHPVNVETSNCIAGADLDQDGDIDIAVGTNSGTSWLENTGGLWISHQLSSLRAAEVAVSDMDGDGDIDLVACGLLNLLWFENSGGLFTTHTIYQGDTSNEVHPVDVDSDGDMDVITTYDAAILYRMTDDGWSRELISDSLWGRSTDSALDDLDGDGDYDLVYTLGSEAEYHDPSVFVLWNQGDSWTESIVTYALHEPGDVTTGDMDQDGSVEIISVSARLNQLALFKQRQNNWEKRLIDGLQFRMDELEKTDMDGDGDMDFLCVSETQSTILFYVNQGDHWEVVIVSDTAWQPKMATAADVNGDGIKDVVALIHDGRFLVWYEMGLDEPVRHYITHDGYRIFTTICAGDMDHDGDADVVTGLPPNLMLYTQEDGFWSGEIVGAINTLTNDRLLYDVDLDGNLDIVDARGGLVWNQRVGDEWIEHLVFDSNSQRNFVPGDVDGDGDTDFISRHSNYLYLSLNQGDGTYITTLESDELNYFDAADLDGDQDIDIMCNLGQLDKLYLYEWVDGAYQSHDLDEAHIRDLYVGDYDSDGDNDLVQIARGRIGWRENTGNNSPLQQFQLQREISAIATLTSPDEYSLVGLYPNPFNSMTTAQIALPEAAELNVTVYNVMGQQVATLAHGRLNAGTHSFTFDASNIASGLYFVRATVPGQLDELQKIMLVR
jgi:FG-GAP-like repeat/Secretion system C-terminal sorting domain